MAERVVIEGPGRRVPESVVDVGASWSRCRNPFIGFRLPDVTGECGCVDGKAKGTHELAGAPECDCHPGGFTPDAFESPQEHCRVHGRAES